MRTWVLVIFLWSDVRPVATVSSIYGYATWDECRVAMGQLESPDPRRFRINMTCVQGPPRGGIFQ